MPVHVDQSDDMFVRIEGAAVKHVVCSRCGCEYSYHMRRSAAFERGAFHNWDTRETARQIDRGLRKSCDPVPCPDCGRYQSNMVWRVKWLWLKWLGGLGLLAWLGGDLVPRWSVLMKGRDFAEPLYPPIPALTYFGWALIGLALLIVLLYSPNLTPVLILKKYGPAQRIRPGRGRRGAYAAPTTAAAPQGWPAPALSEDWPGVGGGESAAPEALEELQEVQEIPTAPPAAPRAATGPITVVCAGCGTAARVPAHAAGKRVKCKKCGRVSAVPSAGAGLDELEVL